MVRSSVHLRKILEEEGKKSQRLFYGEMFNCLSCLGNVLFWHPGWILLVSMLSMGARKTHRHSDCAEISGIDTKGY